VPELFPLPFFEGADSPTVVAGGSRTAGRRALIRRATRRDANSAVAALNALYGCRTAHAGATTEAQAGVLQHVLATCRDARQDFVCTGAKEAFHELLGPKADYNGGSCTVVEYDSEKVSLPALGGAAVDLGTVLDGAAVSALENFESQLLADEDVVWERQHSQKVVDYMDTSLASDRAKYLEFLRSLVKRGLLRVSRRRRGRIKPFFVEKKGGKQRLVFDCRSVNQLFRRAPYTELAAAESFSSVETEEGELLYTATADIQACFYQCGIDEALSEFFCMPSISRAEARSVGLDAGVGADDDLVFPSLAVLPMGWTWAFWFVQRAHLELVRRAGLKTAEVASGAWPFPSLRDGPVEIPYCDNITVVGLVATEVRAARDLVLHTFEAAGFQMHEVSAVCSETEVLGCDLGGATPSSRRTGRKLWLLRSALEWVASGPVVTGRQLEVLVGHFVAACLFNRAGLSIMRALYDFIAVCYDTPTRLWKSARYECWIMSALTMLLGSDLSRPWSETVTCSDASPWGLGVCEKSVPCDKVAEMGRWQERWRFKRLEPNEWAPRRRALGELDEITDPRTVHNTLITDDCDWKFRVGFPEVPEEECRAEDWKTVYAGKFAFKESIGILEGRAFLWALRKAAKNLSSHSTRRLFLIDNFGVCCSVARGRAANYCMLQICRRSSALQLATRIFAAVRWVASERNPADAPSRVFQRGEQDNARCQKQDWERGGRAPEASEIPFYDRKTDPFGPKRAVYKTGETLQEEASRGGYGGRYSEAQHSTLSLDAQGGRQPPFACRPVALRAASSRLGGAQGLRQALRQVRCLGGPVVGGNPRLRRDARAGAPRPHGQYAGRGLARARGGEGGRGR